MNARFEYRLQPEYFGHRTFRLKPVLKTITAETQRTQRIHREKIRN